MSHQIRTKAVRLDQNLTVKRFEALGIEKRSSYRIVYWELDENDSGEELAMIVDLCEMDHLNVMLSYFNYRRQIAKDLGHIVTIETH